MGCHLPSYKYLSTGKMASTMSFGFLFILLIQFSFSNGDSEVRRFMTNIPTR